jgi:ATP-dependent exoDNAse (exonuclease V) alpha subunit
VKTLNEPVERYLTLTRISFKFRLPYGESYQLTRLQIPLRLAYAMTYNKSQSQTLHKVLVDCTGEPFAHGHAYVSFSRVRLSDNICAYVHEEQLQPVGDSSSRMMPVITNIVYKDILI